MDIDREGGKKLRGADLDLLVVVSFELADRLPLSNINEAALTLITTKQGTSLRKLDQVIFPHLTDTDQTGRRHLDGDLVAAIDPCTQPPSKTRPRSNILPSWTRPVRSDHSCNDTHVWLCTPKTHVRSKHRAYSSAVLIGLPDDNAATTIRRYSLPPLQYDDSALCGGFGQDSAGR